MVAEELPIISRADTRAARDNRRRSKNPGAESEERDFAAAIEDFTQADASIDRLLEDQGTFFVAVLGNVRMIDSVVG